MPLDKHLNYEHYKSLTAEERFKSISSLLESEMDNCLYTIFYELHDKQYLKASPEDLSDMNDDSMDDYTDILGFDLEDIACMINKYQQGSTQHAVINLRLKHGVEAGDWEDEDLYYHEEFIKTVISIIKLISYDENIYWTLNEVFKNIGFLHSLAVMINNKDLIHKTSLWLYQIPIK